MTRIMYAREAGGGSPARRSLASMALLITAVTGLDSSGEKLKIDKNYYKRDFSPCRPELRESLVWTRKSDGKRRKALCPTSGAPTNYTVLEGPRENGLFCQARKPSA